MTLPKPPQSRSNNGWPAPEQMFKYFAEIRFELDTQCAISRRDINEYYSQYPRAYEAVDLATQEAMAHFHTVVDQYENVCKFSSDNNTGDYNLMMLKFFSQMGEHFKKAMDVTSVDSIMQKLYNL